MRRPAREPTRTTAKRRSDLSERQAVGSAIRQTSGWMPEAGEGGDDGLAPDARVLLIGDQREQDERAPVTTRCSAPRRSQRRRLSCPPHHGPEAVASTVAANVADIPLSPDGVDVAVEHDGRGRSSGPGPRATRLGRPPPTGRGDDRGVEARSRSHASQVKTITCLAGAPGTSAGLTLSIPTSTAVRSAALDSTSVAPRPSMALPSHPTRPSDAVCWLVLGGRPARAAAAFLNHREVCTCRWLRRAAGPSRNKAPQRARRSRPSVERRSPLGVRVVV